jgi:cytochrome c5
MALAALAGCSQVSDGNPTNRTATMDGIHPSGGLAGSGVVVGQPTGLPNGGPTVSNPVTTGTAGAGSAPVTTANAPSQSTGQALPCNVANVVGANCQKCHGATPIGGAPMSLVTYDDFHKQAKSNPSLKVYELAKLRINDQAKPMPPGGDMAKDSFTVLDSWLGAGALAAAADASCATTKPPTTIDTPGDGTYGPITAVPGETCYELLTHQSTTSVDSTPYSVSTGEHYEQFYFNVPWKQGDQGTRYGTRFDNEKVLHHWLLFTTVKGNPEGFHETVIGTQIGDSAALLAGWAVGGTNLALQDDVAFELPPPGTMLNLQWHFYNSTGSEQQDASAVQVCTVPAGTRPNSATISWLGTEDLGGNKYTLGAGMPPHQMSSYGGTCDPLREGMNATEPIHILGFWPHMHKLGVRMNTMVNHQGGASEMIFDKAFDFQHQVHYLQKYDLMPGDTLTATCTYNNTTDSGAAFGESTDDEMCYQFTFSYPAHALENHVFSFIGASNTCWD